MFLSQFSRRSCLCLAYRHRKPPKFGPNVSPSANDPMLPSRSCASRSAAGLCFHRVESYSAYDGLPVRRPSRSGGSIDATDWKSVIQGDQNARTGGYRHRQRLCQPSGLECQSVWIDQSVLHSWPCVAITSKQPYARSAPSAPPPLTPPAKAPVEKGGQAVGWSGREV